jgi:hypothetical protein
MTNEGVERQIIAAREMVMTWLQRAGAQGEVLFWRDSRERTDNPTNTCTIKVDAQTFHASDNDFERACKIALDQARAARPDLASKAEADVSK